MAVLPVEVENVFDGPEVTGFVWGSGCIFDVVERRELVFSGSCDNCAGVGAGALERWSPLPCACFSPQSASTLAASGSRLTIRRDCFEVLVSDGLIPDQTSTFGVGCQRRSGRGHYATPVAGCRGSPLDPGDI